MQQVDQELFSSLMLGLGLRARWLKLLAVLFASALMGYAQETVEIPSNYSDYDMEEVHEFITNELEKTYFFGTNVPPETPVFGQTNVSVPIRALPPNQLSSPNTSNQPGVFVVTNLPKTNGNPQDNEESSSRREFEARLRNSSVATPITSASSSGTNYSAFKIVLDRNIFNQNRTPGRPQYVRREEPERRRTEAFSLVGTMGYENGVYAFFDGTSSEYRKTVKPDDEIAGYKVTEIGYNSVKLAANATNQVVLPVGMQMTREDFGEWTLGPQTASYAGSSGGGYSSRSFDRGSGDYSSRFGRGSGDYSSRSDRGRGDYSSRSDRGRTDGSDRSSRDMSRTSFSSSSSEPQNTTPSNPSASSDTGAGGDASEMLRKLMERREQELNK